MHYRQFGLIVIFVVIFATLLTIGIVELVKHDRNRAAPYQINLASGSIDTTVIPDITNTTQDPFPDSYYGQLRTWWNQHPKEWVPLDDAHEYTFLLHFYHPALTITTFQPVSQNSPLSYEPIKEYIQQHVNVVIGQYIPRSSYLVVCTPPIARQLSALQIPLSTFNTTLPSNIAPSSNITLYVLPFPNDAKLVGILNEWKQLQNQGKLSTQPQQDPRLVVVLMPRNWTEPETMALATEWTNSMNTLKFDARVIVDNTTLGRMYIALSGAVVPSQILTVATWFTTQRQVIIVERESIFTLHNINAQWITQSGDTTLGPARQTGGRPIWEAGIQGQNQTVGCADSGLDWDHCFFVDPNNPPTSAINTAARKVISYQPLANYKDDPEGHGTHVVGSITGDPTPDAVSKLPEIGNYQGMAPKAQVYFQDVGDDQGSLSGLSGDLYTTIFNPAYQAGARIHSNSWGSNERYYTTNAQSVDQFVWDHPDMFIIFAAGNDGVSAGSVSGNAGSPATAKNILAVGAEQTSNAGFKSALDFVPWQEKQQQAAQQLNDPNLDCCTYNNPNVQDYCCQSVMAKNIANDPIHYNNENMAAFSSRGPTSDGRVKPEIVAPGSYVVSAHSDGNPGQISGNTQCLSRTSALLSMEGTSMATPVTAGNAVLVRQYLVEGWYPTGVKNGGPSITPPASLMAAIMLASTRSLTGYIDEDNTGQYATLKAGTYPLNVFQGFGKLQLANSLYIKGKTTNRLFIDYSQSLSTGQDMDYCITTTSNTQLHIVMVYHDYPAQPNADPASVNNLDLIVGRTSSDALAGNFITNRDEKNNAEHVIFPTSGTVATGTTVYVKVRGWNVPSGGTNGQPYSLAVVGQFDPQSVTQGSKCNSQNFVISQEQFAPATTSQYFPYGPVVGGVAGGLTFLGIIAIIVRFLLQRVAQTV